LLVVSFDEDIVSENRSGTDEGDEVRCVDCPPSSLGGVDKRVGDGQLGGI
jgi:hypothetical protein